MFYLSIFNDPIEVNRFELNIFTLFDIQECALKFSGDTKPIELHGKMYFRLIVHSEECE